MSLHEMQVLTMQRHAVARNKSKTYDSIHMKLIPTYIDMPKLYFKKNH